MSSTRSTSSGTARAPTRVGGARCPNRRRSTRSSSCTPRALTACDPNPTKQASVIDLASGTFKIRVTGRPSSTATQRRSIVATFRRKGFLNFIYFTDYENVDPQALGDDSDRDLRAEQVRE